ncbi:hypothetical protein ES703_24895 [subsurface metagenome]
MDRGHYARAALLAMSLGLSEEEIQDLRFKALWQMSAIYRNAPGTKTLAQQYGFSKEELLKFLKQHTEEKRNDGDDKPLEPCYDHKMGKHLTFEEWIDQFFKGWDKLSVNSSTVLVIL